MESTATPAGRPAAPEEHTALRRAGPPEDVEAERLRG
jgi:hypothetical protein